MNDEEIKIVKLKLEGQTQKEIAEVLGYKTHSAISKKMVKIREKVKYSV